MRTSGQQLLADDGVRTDVQGQELHHRGGHHDAAHCGREGIVNCAYDSCWNEHCVCWQVYTASSYGLQMMLAAGGLVVFGGIAYSLYGEEHPAVPQRSMPAAHSGQRRPSASAPPLVCPTNEDVFCVRQATWRSARAPR